MKLEKQVAQIIKKYKLLNKKEKIVVALSGGKDSTSVIYILHKLGYKVEGLFIDLHVGCWSEESLKSVVGLCRRLGIGLRVFDLKKELNLDMNKIQKIAKKKNVSGCYVCGVLKKWLINREARKMGADKIVTGHNLDDEVETVLMNFLKGNIFLGANSGIITEKQKGFVQRVKPLFFLSNDDVRKYAKNCGLDFVGESCPYLKDSYRLKIRKGFDELRLGDKDKLNIVKSWLNVFGKFQKSKTDNINFCKNCGEPCRGDLCKVCEILGNNTTLKK